MNQNESTPGPTTSSVIGFLFRQYCSRHPLRLVYKGFLKNKIVLFCRTPLPGQAVTQATWTTLFVRRTVFVGMLLERKHCSVRERCSWETIALVIGCASYSHTYQLMHTRFVFSLFQVLCFCLHRRLFLKSKAFYDFFLKKNNVENLEAQGFGLACARHPRAPWTPP